MACRAAAAYLTRESLSSQIVFGSLCAPRGRRGFIVSVWDISFQKKAIDAMQDPRWVSLIANVCRKLNAGEYDQWFVDCLTQQWSGNKPGYDIYDAYAFALFWADIIHGDIAYAVIDVSEPPKGDRAKAANNAILSTLPQPFRAAFEGGAGDHDGELHWDVAITLAITRLDADNQQVFCHTTRAPAHAPLEVGYTMPGRTLGHLRTERMVARWPYSHNRVGIFVQLRFPGESQPS